MPASKESESQKRPREVLIPHHDYQPSKAELEADLRVDATFEEAVDALAQPVRIRHVIRPE